MTLIGIDPAAPGTDRTVVMVFASAPCAGHARPIVRPLTTSFRACELCSHAVARAGRLLCGRAAGQLGGPPESLDAARSATGACGPNALHLDIPSWHA